MSLQSSSPTVTHSLHDFTVRWDAECLQLSVHKQGRCLWESVPGVAFLAAASGAADVRESRGFFLTKDQLGPWSTVQHLDTVAAEDGVVVLSGRLEGSVTVSWTATLRALDELQLHLDVQLGPELPGEPRALLRFASVADERFFGFGAQLTHVDLKGRCLTLLSQEPGIGRGIQPLTWFMNTVAGAGGDDTRSSTPMPHFLTSRGRSLCLENHELCRFDLRAADRVEVEVWSARVGVRLYGGATPAEQIEAHTRFTGRMPPLPEWIQRGAVVGMQGGTEAARRMVASLQAANAPIAALWLQDWVGARKTSVGWQLWWNWELDPQRYPDWDGLRAELERDGTRILSYVNPFLVDVSERTEPCRRNLFQEGKERGFLVKKQDGSPYLVKNTSFSAAMIDLTHPEARAWMKEVLKEQVIGVGASGWMADFAEALPFDAVLHDGSDAAAFHNAYPEAWAQLNREAIQEAGREGDVVFFTRAGFTRSPGHSTLFWLGDQLTSWRSEDGIRSGVTGLLSSGFSGISQNHSDIGGYITTAVPGLPLAIPLLDYRRSAELLHRWIELNAFTAVFRTHEGNQPARNHQIDDAPESLEHFARFARVYAALAPLRTRLGLEASERGLPVVRHPWLTRPDDPETPGLCWQFTLGSCLWVAPVLDPGATSVTLYLPAGCWQHLWSDATLTLEAGGWVRVQAPMGAPAVFFEAGDADGLALVKALDATGDRADWSADPQLTLVGAPT